MTVSKKGNLASFNKLYISLVAAACVNFSQSVYEVVESSGSVDICLDLDASLEDNLTVSIFTIPGTATGKAETPPYSSSTFTFPLI